jgi:hypothetical protein
MSMDIAALASSLTAAFDALKKLREVSQRVRDADFQIYVADLFSAMADVKLKLADVQEENLRLRRELEQFRQQTDIRKKLVLKHEGYYLTSKVEGYGEGPFCTPCMDTKGTLVTIQFDGNKSWCPICKTSTWKNPPMPRVTSFAW